MVLKRICALVVLYIVPLLLWSQRRMPEQPISSDYIGLGFDAGITKFFGDIDDQPAQGQTWSNNTAYQFLLAKNFKAIFELEGKISFGGISGEKSRSDSYQYFKTRFIEYTADASINFLEFFTSASESKFGIYGKLGIGLIDFKTKLYNGVNDSVIRSVGYGDDKATTEMVIPIGLRAVYHISPSSAVGIQVSSSRVNTDKIDTNTGNNNSDYYMYFSVGYIYKFFPENFGANRSKKSNKSKKSKSVSKNPSIRK